METAVVFQHFTQRQIATVLDVSEMTVSRAVRTLSLESRPLCSFDAWQIMAYFEFQELGLAPHVVREVMAEFKQETLFVYKHPDNRAWVVFIRRGEQEFRTSSMSEAHLAAICDLFPLTLVLPLHAVAERARQRLTALKTRKAAA